jgi:uncharacterized protein (TIGR03067 family)
LVVTQHWCLRINDPLKSKKATDWCKAARFWAQLFFGEPIMRCANSAVVAAVLALSIGAGRGNGGAAEEASAKSSGKLDGRWQVTRQEERGGLVPPVVSKRLSMVIEDGEMGWYIGNPAPNLTATITINAQKKTIDAEITRGSFIGKKMLGIYRLHKDVLEMCWGTIGTDKRPVKFTTKPGAGGGFNYTTYKREKPVDDSPRPEEQPQAREAPAAKKPRLSDLKFTLPKGWEAKHKAGSNTWEISQGFTPTVVAGWALPRDYPRILDDYVERLQNAGDHFAYGFYWTSVTGKGKLPDGLYVVGKVKEGKAGKEDKRIGFSIIRQLGGEKVIFESFSSYYDDARLLRAAMDICKAAKF